MKETYTREEVKGLILPLIEQIKLFHKINLMLKSWIISPFWKRQSPESLLSEIQDIEDNSGTIIFELVKWAKDNPSDFDMLYDFYKKEKQN